MEYVIAVLDIGKTNKKIVIYDDKLRQIDSIYSSIPTVNHGELDVENVKEIERWFYENLKVFSKKYNIKSISISTHGATCVCIDNKGDLAVPVVAYTNEVTEKFHNEFNNLVGTADTLQEETGTAQVKPLINLAKLIYFIQKRYPEDYKKTENILMYPSYFGYKLTGKIAADYTYTGCHTYLWNFKDWTWSNVVNKLNIQSKLPTEVKNPGEVLGTITKEMALLTGLSQDTVVTVGIHDSNSSLIPYLLKGDDNFILNSTGTWCVVMHPTKEYSFSKDEIGKTVFYNISAEQDLVKTAIFMGGLEFETYMTLIKKINNKEDYPNFDMGLIQSIINKNSEYIIPGIMKGAGQFPETSPVVIEDKRIYSTNEITTNNNPGFFENYEYAYTVLNLSLAIQTKVSIDRVKAPKGSPIYIEGGFRNNDVYIKLIASMYPDNPVYITNISEATSFGAALLGKSALKGIPLNDLKEFVDIEMTKVESVKLDNIFKYMDSFLSRI
ncbi:MAG: FGGY family carbohydrate kinase [Spirochaetaceae bacterium]